MTETQEFASVTALANLAKAGSSVARQSLMQVNFQVHHISDRGGYLRDLLSKQLDGNSNRSSPMDSPTPRETLSSASNGVGLVIGTYTGPLGPELQSRRQGSSLPVALKVDDQEGARIFHGTGWPNPTFIYESSRVFEGLISIEDEPRVLSYKHSQAICELLHQISSLAAESAGAPILLLQCPVQMPGHRFVDTDVRTRREEWPRFSAIAVRFAIALQHSSAKQRLHLADLLSRFCSERGYGFWLNDTRAGHRSGNWFLIRSHDRARARRSLERWSRKSTAGGPLCCLPVTFVGPARVGSTHSILSFIREFRDLGVLGCSVTSLDDLAFVHLQLAINDTSPSKLPVFQQVIEDAIGRIANSKEPKARTSTPQDLLPTILPMLAPNHQHAPRHEALAYLTDRAGNYQTLAGPAMPISNMAIKKRKSIWFSWRAEGSDAGLALPVIALYDAMQATGLVLTIDDTAETVTLEPNIEYLICRDVGDSILHGKGKMSFPMELLTRGPSTAPESDGGRLCTSLEDAWRAELEQNPVAGVVELSVAWLEHRLSHYTLSV